MSDLIKPVMINMFCMKMIQVGLHLQFGQIMKAITLCMKKVNGPIPCMRRTIACIVTFILETCLILKNGMKMKITHGMIPYGLIAILA